MLKRDTRLRLSRAPTSADVARHAGVSQATISLVMNGQAERGRISIETRSRVLSAAAELGYTPNHAARSLRRRATKVLTFVLPSIENPYFSEIVSGAQAAAKQVGYSVTIIPLDETSDELQTTALLQGSACDGIVVAGHDNCRSPELSRLASRGVSVVVLQESSSDPSVRSVSVDFETGGFLATRHLIELGHRRIAHIMQEPRREGSGRARIDGYRRAHAEAGLAVDEALVAVTENSMDGGSAAAERLVGLGKRRPTAIFAYNDQLAIGALHGLHRRGVAVPAEIAVVGFDGIAAGRFAFPELTTIDTPRDELGRVAVETLVAAIEKQECAEARLLPVRLTVRESCGAARRANAAAGNPSHAS